MTARRVTVEDFVDAMADVSGRDLSQFMRWYTQSGTPELACSLDYDAHAKTARLAVSQVVPPTPGQTKKEPMLTRSKWASSAPMAMSFRSVSTAARPATGCSK
jgi:aminopeptidase N